MRLRNLTVLFGAVSVLGCVGIGAAVATGHVTDDRVANESTQRGNWLVKGGGFSQQQFSALHDITDKNVGQLGLAWHVDIDAPMGLAAEPIVVDGVIYLSAPQSRVYAIEAASGKIKWQFDPHVRLDIGLNSSYSARVNRGVAVWDGKVYVATGDCRMIAIDASTGAQAWSTIICDARQTGSTGAPRVARGKVFIGYNGSDDQVRGSVVALDAATGKEAWRFWTVPGDPAKGFESKALESAAKTWRGPQWWWHGGGAVWDAITFDPLTGYLLFGTSSAHRGEGTTTRLTADGAKLFAGCIVAVNADTGEYAWHVQTSSPKRQTENFHIVLADLKVAGTMRHVAMTVPRIGEYFVIDAKSGQVISKQAIVRQGVPGPGDDAPSGATVISEAEMCTGCWGVHNWWPMSYSPATRLAYVPIMDLRRAVATHGEEFPFVGRLVAWDPQTQSQRWSVEHALAINSGVLSTAGNLVFQGQGSGDFSAYAADSGRRLWSVQTGSAIDAVPVSFAWKSEQYILVPIGWGSAARMFTPSRMMTTEQSKRGPARLLAFKLGANKPVPIAPFNPSPVPKPPPLQASAASIRHGEELAESHLCTGCHSPQFNGSGGWTEGGAVPDLRYMPESAHRNWYATVLGGLHRPQGMMNFGADLQYPEIAALTRSDADDIHAYVIRQAWKAYEAQQRSRVSQ